MSDLIANVKSAVCSRGLRDEKGAETKFNSLSNEKPSVRSAAAQEYGELTRNSSFSNENVLSPHKNCFSLINH